MPFKVGSRVQEDCTVAGTTGNVVLGGAKPSFFSFASVPVEIGDTCWILIEGIASNAREICLATMASGGQLVRGAVIRSTNGNLPVSWPAGAAVVSLTDPGEKTAVIDGDGDMNIAANVVAQMIFAGSPFDGWNDGSWGTFVAGGAGMTVGDGTATHSLFLYLYAHGVPGWSIYSLADAYTFADQRGAFSVQSDDGRGRFVMYPDGRVTFGGTDAETDTGARPPNAWHTIYGDNPAPYLTEQLAIFGVQPTINLYNTVTDPADPNYGGGMVFVDVGSPDGAGFVGWFVSGWGAGVWLGGNGGGMIGVRASGGIIGSPSLTIEGDNGTAGGYATPQLMAKGIIPTVMLQSTISDTTDYDYGAALMFADGPDIGDTNFRAYVGVLSDGVDSYAEFNFTPATGISFGGRFIIYDNGVVLIRAQSFEFQVRGAPAGTYMPVTFATVDAADNSAKGATTSWVRSHATALEARIAELERALAAR